jgi:hypothetical protein
MPAQLPVATIISMSNWHRCSSRCASSSFPCWFSTASLPRSSSLMLSTAWFSVGLGVT